MINWGIMGTGRIAKTFCETLKGLEQAQIYAVGSRTQKKAEEFGTAHGILVSCASYEELVNQTEVDIVYVATPIGCHYENVMLCLEAGKHVLCEKALTETGEQAKRLQETARRKGLLLLEAMWSKCQPGFQRMMEWKQSGLLGDILGVEAKFYTMGTSEHRLLKNKNHGGALYDLTIYPITYACALLGYKPTAISAVAAKGGDDVDTMESIQLMYGGGSFASLSGGIAGKRQVSLYIHGTRGRILLEQEYFYNAQHITIADWDNHVMDSFEEPFLMNGYEYEALEAMRCVEQGCLESNLLPLEESIHVIEIMEECRKQWS